MPECSVYTIKYRDDKGRVVYFQTTVETDDLKDGCNNKQDDSKNGRSMSKLISRVFMRQGARQQLDAKHKSDTKSEYREFQTTHVAFANTKQPPARPPPQHAQPIPNVQATCLSSLGAAHTSKRSVTKLIMASHEYLKTKNRPNILANQDFRPAPTLNGILETGKPEPWVLGTEKGTAANSVLAARTASSLEVNMRRKNRENDIIKKYPSQPPRRQR